MKEEWKSIFQSTWIKVVLIAIMIIPMAYAGIFLGSMWDPYGNADKIPVAVVNEDKAVEYNDTSLHIGNDLVSNLKENKAMDFHFVNRKEAQKGLKNGDYYMIITIPQDFSHHATTLLDDHPQKMVLTYETNPGTNYIASKMDETAVHKIKENVSASVTTTYADTLFSQVKTLSGGLKDASDGSKKLEDGVDQTLDGNKKIEQNLSTLASSSLTFKDGSDTLQSGLKDYTDGVGQLYDGSEKLSIGMRSMQENASILAGGIDFLYAGSTRLNTGINEYTNGVDTLAAGTQELTTNNDSLNAGVQALSVGSTQAKDGSEQVLTGLQNMSVQLSSVLNDTNKANIEGLLAQNDGVLNGHKAEIAALKAKAKNGTITDEEMNTLTLYSVIESDKSTLTLLYGGMSNVQSALDRQGTTPQTMGLLQGMQMVNDGISQIDTGINGEQGLKNGIQAYTSGVNKLQLGALQLKQNSGSLRDGIQQLQSGTEAMNDGAPALQDGIHQLSIGAGSLYDGTSMLVRNNPQLLRGIASLSDGSAQISDGAAQLAEGSATLGNGLIQLKDGSSTLSTSLQDGADKSNIAASKETKEMLAQPLDVEHKEMSNVESNGKAMAPYMMSVGLYVACMAFTLMYPLLKNNSKTTSGFRLWLSKASVMYAVSTIMAVVMITALTLINGLSPLQFTQTLLMACLISAAFMSMIVFFNITCGKIGAFLVLIFMVFQLGGAAGTYPIETSDTFYQIIHSFMPFTYSVEAFRETLAIGGSIVPQILVFTGMILVFSSLSILFYRWKVSISEEQFKKTKLAQFHN